MSDTGALRVAGGGERQRLKGGWRAADLQLCNDYLGYWADPAGTRRPASDTYAFDLLHFGRWLAGEDIGLDGVDTDGLLEPRPRAGPSAARVSTTM